MNQFDDVMLGAFYEPDLAGLVDRIRDCVTPVRAARVILTPSGSRHFLRVVDGQAAEYHYRDSFDRLEAAQELAAAFQARFDQAAGKLGSVSLAPVLSGMTHRSSLGVTWSLSMVRRLLSPAHTYWMYLIRAEVGSGPGVLFTAMVKKDRVATLEQAEDLAKTEALDAVIGLIDGLRADERRPLTIVRSAQDAWVMI